MRGQNLFYSTVKVIWLCLLVFAPTLAMDDVVTEVSIDSPGHIDAGAVISTQKNTNDIKNTSELIDDSSDQAIDKRYYIVQRNNNSQRFGLGNLIRLEVVYPVLQSLPKAAACQWSFDKEIRLLGINYDNGDNGDDCELTLQYPYEPQPVSSDFSYQVQVIVTSQDSVVSQPITQTLSFKNHLDASLAVNSATLSKTKPIVFHVLPKNQENPFPSEISCLTHLIEKPFEVRPTSENGCSGEVVLTPQDRLTSVAKKSLQRSSHRVGIIIKYNGLNIGRQVINFSIDA